MQPVVMAGTRALVLIVVAMLWEIWAHHQVQLSLQKESKLIFRVELSNVVDVVQTSLQTINKQHSQLSSS